VVLTATGGWPELRRLDETRLRPALQAVCGSGLVPDRREAPQVVEEVQDEHDAVTPGRRRVERPTRRGHHARPPSVRSGC
jgi:hypothetical protein